MSFEQLVADLAAEQAELDAIVAGLEDPEWDTPTPAEGWAVRHQIAHLAQGEELAAQALSGPDAFRAHLQTLLADLDAVERMLEGDAERSGAEILEAWRAARGRVVSGLNERDGRDRIPWVAGDMGAMSFATARIMETYAHGLDVSDGLRVRRVPTPRLRHIADLGVRTRAFSYQNRGLPVRDTPVRVELDGPTGEIFSWGPEDATNRVTGSVEGFAQVVTHRRNPLDVELATKGDAAAEWIAIAQCYAGPPTDQRPPGGDWP